MIRLDLSKCQGFAHHRSGWNFCISQLKCLHSKSGILMDDFIERSFAWKIDSYYNGKNIYNLPYQKEWVGFLHNPPNAPSWFDVYNSPEAILNRAVFQQSLQTCKCLITLSEYLKDWLQPRVNIPIISVKHPTEMPEHKWNPIKYASSHNIPLIQIGYWLRKFDAICKVKCGPRYQKIWLPSNYDYAFLMLNVYQKTQQSFYEYKHLWSGVKTMKHISNIEFDKLMDTGVVLLDLYDSSANNAIVECIARNTPILVNKIPPVVEYLGKNYPLYFDNIDEVPFLLDDQDKILKAHYYLKRMNKCWISGKYFAMDIQRKLMGVL